VPDDPARQYSARLEARRATHSRLDRTDARLSHARLAAFGAAVVVAVLAWRIGLSLWWLTVPAAVFTWLIRRHDTVLRQRDAALRGVAFYERGLARLADRWAGSGDRGDRFRDDQHPYANDLDLFGRGSLFELLSLARTRTGEAVLARWLTTPADATEVRSRQEAVAELRSALDLREHIELSGADVRAAVHTDRLVEWARQPMPPTRSLHLTTWLLTTASAAGIAWMAATSDWRPLGVVLLMQASIFHRQRDELEAIVTGKGRAGEADFVGDALSHRTRDLEVVGDVLHHLEGATFRGARLVRLRGRLASSTAEPASRIIRRLGRLSNLRDSTRNLAVFPLGLFLLGQLELSIALGTMVQLATPHVVLGVDRWRRRHGAAVVGWLDAIGEFEAFSSLSCYRYEHPEDVFPDLISPGRTGPRAVFDGRELGHPLLPAGTMVRNDVRLAGSTQLLVVSGSNMSGKSTLLRTVGINAVLALSGAPVRAASLEISPLAIGATLRIQDSLQEGRSRFYAEITRIRELSDMADGPGPLLFLLDELFHGTNSHDRLVGASGVLRSFLDRGAIGLITTHDLALTAVAEQLAPRAANVHFEDWFDGGEIRFDYRMKPGPVTRSNAIALMRAVGLDVDVPSGA
jgi:hypothetical protein